MTDFAKRLKQRRESLHLTQAQVAAAADVNRSTIAYYEDGKRLPALNTLIGIAKILEVDLDWLAGLETDIHASVSAPVYQLPEPGEPLEIEKNIVDVEMVKRTDNIMFCFIAKDNSMSGIRIFKDDLVCVKKLEKLSAADVVVVDVQDHGVLVRRVIFDEEDTIVFHAEESTVADLVFEKEEKKKPPYRIIGKVAYSKVRGVR